jgi:hypothetical protein
VGEGVVMRRRRMSRVGVGLVAVLSLALAPWVAAQEFGEVGQAFKNNLQRLRGYTWKSTVDFYVDGKHTGTKLYEVTYGPDGRIERTVLEEQGKVSGKAQVMAEDELSQIRSLIDGYTHMDPKFAEKMFADEPRNVQRDEATGLNRVRTQSFLHRGDTVTAWVDPATYALHKLKLDTASGKWPVQVEADFERIDDGPMAVRESTLVTRNKKKAVRIVTKNSEFRRP